MPPPLFLVIIWSRILEPEAQEQTPTSTPKRSYWIWARRITLGLVIVAVVAVITLFLLYKASLNPKEPGARTSINVSVESGQPISTIASQLEQKGIISNAVSFEWYVRLEHPRAVLQAGRYALSPRMSSQEIIQHLEKGDTDVLKVTIYPGNTLTDIKKTLQKNGYSAKEIDAAFKAQYTHPLLADRPPGQDLEGYLFPETFEIRPDTTLETLFIRDFDTLYKRLKNDGLLDKFKAHGLNTHQALTLASIIQQETDRPKDQSIVAQVFYTRLANDMKLESDTTFFYAADKLGVQPSVTLESPYNTRIHKGLPPGPIGNMNYSALQAVAEPASTDFLYFVAGDNGESHFAHTLEEHEANSKKYCHKLCS
jgi:UPF0755 protein